MSRMKAQEPKAQERAYKQFPNVENNSRASESRERLERREFTHGQRVN